MNGFSTASAIGTVAAFIVTAAGGATIAAETSVPGDAFYAVKRSVTEPFRESLAFGAAANADIEGDLAVRRLGEINSLAAQNRLDEETRVQLSEEFKAHAEASTRFAVQAGEEGNADAVADVTASIAQDIRVEEEELREHEEENANPALGISATLRSASSFRAKLMDVNEDMINIDASAETETTTEVDVDADDSQPSSTASQSSTPTEETDQGAGLDIETDGAVDILVQ